MHKVAYIGAQPLQGQALLAEPAIGQFAPLAVLNAWTPTMCEH